MKLPATLRVTVAIASALLCTGLLTSCDQSDSGSAGVIQCNAETTPIAAIQGDQYTSTMVGSEVLIRGIITRLQSGTGFYIEQPGSDKSRASSNALFVEDPDLSHKVSAGQVLVLSGQVSELGKARNTLTAITGVSRHKLCDEGIDLPQTLVELPLNSRQREALESMRIILDQQLISSDVYNLYRGEVTLSAKGGLRVFTEDNQPGPAAAQAAKKNWKWTLRTVSSEPNQPVLRYGTEVSYTTGIMGNKGGRPVLLLEQPLIGKPFSSPTLAPPQKGNIRLASFNLLNFFNGDGRGDGFPTQRGATNHDDFLAQSGRIRSAISHIEPHLLAVQELENDGFGPRSAARSLLSLLNKSGHGSWTVIEPSSGRVGEDVITVGLFYRADTMTPTGPAHILDSAPFRKISRQPLAQVFQDNLTGQRFLVAVNHLKSKGSCPDSGENSDQHDGQSCWNPARVAAAKAVSDWVKELAVKSGTNHVLILGDMNAWRKEDPIRTFKSQGFAELVEQFAGLPQHSYIYWGAAGTLDYAFASTALLPAVSHAEIWHINSDWPQGMDLPDPWLRSSDHDPVIVDLDLSQLDTSN